MKHLIKYRMDKIYNPKDIEQSLYASWEQHGYFKPNYDTCQESFCIMIPPPNVTGSLHMGHAFQHTIIDILVRYHRMLGKNTLWQVGTDHAGIATQMVVERKLESDEGKTRHDYGRNEFVDKIWQWKNNTSSTITNQMRRLGNSVDWDRERFTMDDGLSNAVKEVFVSLYEEGLIYRGKRLVNWDPKLQTAISDLEVENRELIGSMWYLRYPLADGVKTIDGKDHLVIATTRPETMLGDTGVAVNPIDPRYQDLIGKFIILPLVGRCIPILGDPYSDMIKGTGCVKITPAHDFNDYEVGKKHALPMINIFTLQGNICNEVEVFDTQGKTISNVKTMIPKAFRGLDRFIARKVIVAELERLGLLEAVKPHDLKVPYGDRSGAVIEPMLTDQWYIHTSPLAKIAIEAVEQGSITFIPQQYKNMYFSWMRNIKDWCISRHLWWGHRIPAWYDNKGSIYVGRNESEVRLKNHLDENVTLRQDEDVLDTWFSSAIWSFSTLGWPEKTLELNIFHPTSVVVSGFDIIFFWISRMIMMTMHFIKDKNGKAQVPFKIAYMTGLIRDDKGQKMSKSKGNIIDPIDIIDGISLNEMLKKRTSNTLQPQVAYNISKRTEKQFPHGIKPHGTDALRFTLAALASTGRDINWDMKRLEGYRNFCNKLWNGSRFILMNTQGEDCGFEDGEKVFSIADRWVMSEFNQTVLASRKAIDNYRFDINANILYEFIWSQFCDWYLELSKITLIYGSKSELRGTRYTMVSVLEEILRLAHPVIPFITETIWQKIKIITGRGGNTIMLEKFPSWDASRTDSAALAGIKWIKQIIIAVRSMRIEMKISLNKLLVLILRDTSPNKVSIDNIQDLINTNLKVLCSLAHLNGITLLPATAKYPVSLISKRIENIELIIPIDGEIIEKSSQLERIEKEIALIEANIIRIKNKLNKEVFITRAPKEIIAKEIEKLDNYNQLKIKLLEQKSVLAKI